MNQMYKDACSAASRMGKDLPEPPSNLSSTASQLFKSMQAVAGKMPLTDQYAKAHAIGNC
jgi:hypothetical protein